MTRSLAICMIVFRGYNVNSMVAKESRSLIVGCYQTTYICLRKSTIF